MKGEKISYHINEVCKHLGIDYKSCNESYLQMMKDAEILGQCYRDLKIIAGEIQEVAERHNINGLGKLLEDDLDAIDKLEHDIVKIATKIKLECKNE